MGHIRLFSIHTAQNEGISQTLSCYEKWLFRIQGWVLKNFYIDVQLGVIFTNQNLRNPLYEDCFFFLTLIGVKFAQLSVPV